MSDRTDTRVETRDLSDAEKARLLEAIDDDDIREYLASADGDSGVGP